MQNQTCDEKIVELTIRKSKCKPVIEKFKVRKINGIVSIDNGFNINSEVLARILQKYKQAENEIAGLQKPLEPTQQFMRIKRKTYTRRT